MLEREEFGDNIEAYLRYAQARGAGAEEVLRRELETPAWERPPIPRAWLTSAHQTGSFDRLLDALVERIVSIAPGRSLDGVREILPSVVVNIAIESPDGGLIGRFLDWLLTEAATEPGDASLVADVAEQLVAWSVVCLAATERPTWFAPRVRELAEWLLRSGSAELRASRRSRLIVALAAALQREPSIASTHVALLRHLRSNDRPWQCWAEHPTCEFVWPAVEEGLKTRELNWTFVADLMRTFDGLATRSLDVIFAPLTAEANLPESRAALVRCLESGVIDRSLAAYAWQYAVRLPAPASLEIRDPKTLSASLDALNHIAAGIEAAPLKVRPPQDFDGWVYLVYRNWIEANGLVRQRMMPAGASVLELAAARPILSNGVTRALREAIDDTADDELDLARKVAVDLAGRCLAGLAIASSLPRDLKARQRDEIDWRSLTRELSRVVASEPPDRIGIIDPARLLQGARRVIIDDLGSDNQLQFRGDAVVVDRGALEHQWREASDPSNALVDCLLFFAHELVHRWQGIAGRAATSEIRVMGSESTILHLDLAADHVAARLIAGTLRRWSFLELRDRQGRSLAAFPITAAHTSPARARKAGRLISLRVEYLLRCRGDYSDDEYFFADHALFGGPFMLLASGPPMRVVARCSDLRADDAALLERAADPGQDLDAIDEVLDRTLQHILP